MSNSVLNKCTSAIPPLFNYPQVLSSSCDEAKLFAKNFSKNSNLDDSGISLLVYQYKLYGILLLILLEGLNGGPVFKNVGKAVQLQTAILLVFFLWLRKSLKSL